MLLGVGSSVDARARESESRNSIAHFVVRPAPLGRGSEQIDSRTLDYAKSVNGRCQGVAIKVVKRTFPELWSPITATCGISISCSTPHSRNP